MEGNASFETRIRDHEIRELGKTCYTRGRDRRGMIQVKERKNTETGAQSRFTGGYKTEEKQRTLIPFIDRERIGQKNTKIATHTEKRNQNFSLASISR